jgi:drug/metabolite transporter (DMT)-like permease
MSSQPLPGITPASGDRVHLGIGLCLLSMLVFACLDGITKVLVQEVHIAQIMLVRYLVFTAFALVLARRNGGIVRTLRSQHPWLQGLRALLCLLDVALFAVALGFLGLAETHSLYAVFPLMALALAGVVLGERIGIHQWAAAAIGFTGTLVILRPGAGLFDVTALIPLVAAADFALFTILSRKVSLSDSFATNTFYLAAGGLLLCSVFGLLVWQPLSPQLWLLLGVVSVGGVVANLLLLLAFKFTPATTLQPYNYSLLVFATLVGFVAFGELPDFWTVVGALLVLLGGLLALRRIR